MGHSSENKPTDATWKALHFDVEYYQSLLDDPQIPGDQKQEFVELLWSIAVQFVDLGVGIHPLQQVSPSLEAKTQRALAKLITDFADEGCGAEDNHHKLPELEKELVPKGDKL